jgi:DNA-binding transcriptional LysR family regulator
VLEALRRADIPWRIVSEAANVNAQVAATEADLAVMVLLSSTVPAPLALIGPLSGLPGLPMFSINLYLPRASRSDAAIELARHIRESVMDRQRLAA